jgi:hypothetical protein
VSSAGVAVTKGLWSAFCAWSMRRRSELFAARPAGAADVDALGVADGSADGCGPTSCSLGSEATVTQKQAPLLEIATKRQKKEA